jgi:peptide/nickel transport system ATP-binding protein
MNDLVLDVRNLQVKFNTPEEKLAQRLAKKLGQKLDQELAPKLSPKLAVDDISFQLQRGQTLGIVGESGSGKSVTSLALMDLVPHPGKIIGGEIWFTPTNSHNSGQNSGESRQSMGSGDSKDASRGTAVNLRQLDPETRRSYRGGRMAMIFQEPMSSLNPVFTCGFQLTEAIQLHQQVSLPQARRLAIASLQEVKLLPKDEQLRQEYLQQWQQENPERSATEAPKELEVEQQINLRKQAMLDRYPHQLSGGQLQRMMIAMAISCNPDLLIADEPTTALDVTVQATILDLLRELRDSRQMSLIFITHDLGIIAEIADTVAVMYQGRIVEAGTAMQIFREPQHPYTKGLLSCRPRLLETRQYLPTVSDFMEVVTTDQGVELREKPVDENVVMPGSVGIASPLEDRAINDPLLVVENLRVGFPIFGKLRGQQRMFWAVDDVSFQVFPGETLGLVGESGCGKSTLARTILRLRKPTAGKIFFEGANILPWEGDRLRQLRRQMQIIFQNPYSSLDPRQKIGAAIMEPLVIHKVGQKASQRERAVYLLEKVGLDGTALDRYPHEFSGGQRQRICIARALALNPKFIICDESVSALDVSVQAQVLNLLKALQQEFNLTYIFISHDLSVVKFMSNRIMVMNRGSIEEIDTAENIYRHPTSDYTRQLIAAIPQPALLN